MARIPRSILALPLILTLCAMLLLEIRVPEGYYTLVGMVIAFYFTAKASEIRDQNGKS